MRSIDLKFLARQEGEDLRLGVEAFLGAESLLKDELSLPWQLSRKEGNSRLAHDIIDTFSLLGDAACDCLVSFQGSEEAFVPRSVLKELKQRLNQNLPAAIANATQRALDASLEHLNRDRRELTAASSESFAIKIDRLEYLEAVELFLATHPVFALSEIVFEPKRAFLGRLSPKDIFAPLFAFGKNRRIKIRFAFPTVIRAWDEAMLSAWVQSFLEQGGSDFEIGNIGARTLLDSFAPDRSDLDVRSDFTLYVLNTEAALAVQGLGINTVALSIEDDRDSIEEKLRRWPTADLKPQAIIFKDTPLFIAEACSLTALHGGCPTAAVCGYRTLEIENDEGERFFVAHESCKSIVYGARAFSLSQHRPALAALGIAHFRIDFLTRHYATGEVIKILKQIAAAEPIADTHSANYERSLL